MNKYCKIINEDTGLVQLGVGCPDEYYIEIGMEQRDVQQSDIDYLWYLTEKCPMKTEEQKEQERLEWIHNLRMTPLDFLKAIEQYGITYDMVKQFMEQNPLIERELRFCQNVYRKHPMLDALQEYGLTSEILDNIFIQANERGE